MIETRDKILDAAEKAFADGGYGATSLRSIMADAGVNVAAVHYYFRSKEVLLEAVLMRRVEAANAERLRLLEKYEAGLHGARPAVDEVLRAFLSPTFHMAAEPAQGGYPFVRLLGRLQAESDLLPNIVLSRLGPVLLRFGDALARALPELAPNELFLRARLAMGATAQVMRDAPRIKSLTGSENGVAPDWQSMMERIIPFLSAGFRAPLETQPAAMRAAATNMNALPQQALPQQEETR
jgi:AcrR family transcriptional regulator